MSSCLELVSEQFPLLRERVASLFERDVVFRELCEDYATCALALDRQKFEEDLRKEYSALRLRLETELLGYLQETGAPSEGKPSGRRE
ncbi:MAG TPA: hypothetical protein VL691_15055 [Vicinamibacteria bacterium]|nr:hypothetical protein [Vicinamibacteria bacterium]